MNSETPFDHTNSDDGDVLSLRDLQIYDHTAASSPRSTPRTSSAQDLFEFFTTANSPTRFEDDDVNEFQKRDCLGSSSFRMPGRPIEDPSPIRSVSHRDFGSGHHPVKFSTSANGVNISALTSMSSKSKRRMFMFGPVKFKPEMEMSAIRERQGRLTPSRLFPAAEGGAAAATGKVVACGCGHKNHWGLVRTLSCRARVSTLLARSLACISIQ